MARKRYLDGLDKAERTFRRLPAEAREGLVDALNRGGREIVMRAQALAPVDEGDLRDATERLPIEETPRGLAVTIRNTDFKARWVEFGTTRAPAQPFFWPAVRSLRARVRGRIKRALSKAAKQVAHGR